MIELFAGAGGFTWGWAKAGYATLAAVDSDTAATRTSELNFGGGDALVLNRDLTCFGPVELDQLLGRRAGQAHVIAGGPPCQGWSRAGRGKIRSVRGMAESLLDDPRNTLYKRFLDFVAHFRTPVCVMENVPGMLNLEGVNTAKLIAEHYRNIGYNCTYAIVNARWFGVPQDRRRLIFIGVREDLDLSLDAQGLQQFAIGFRRSYNGLPATVTVRHAISDLPGVGNAAAEDPLIYPKRRGRPYTYTRLMREGSNGLITDHVGRDHKEMDIEAFSTMPEGGLYVDLDKRFKRYRDDIFKDKYRRLRWDQPSWTVTAHLAKDGYSHIHPGQSRTLTIRETARLQSFPDSFRFFGNMGDRLRQIGNAVPPLMSWGIAEYVKEGIHRGRK